MFRNTLAGLWATCVFFALHGSAAAQISTPYGGAPAAVPGTLHAEKFDSGGPNIAYMDTTAGNSGGGYRATDVDIQTSSLGGYNIGWIASGEWLNYTVNAASAGTYRL